MSDFLYGTVLKIQREFSIDDIKKKMNDIKGIGFNTIVIWPSVFWWEDRNIEGYPFNTGKHILEYAEELDLKIIMELAGQITSLEYAPDFVLKDHHYATKRDGSKDFHHFGYGYLNYNHPEVQSLIKKMFQKTGTEYMGYSSLYAYDIWNETMFSSYDNYTLQMFRDWLEKKYITINNLNDVWDRVYYDWSQIDFTTWTWASIMPLVDYNQFKKVNIGMILKEWCGYVKQVDTIHPLIADNISSMTVEDGMYSRPQDDWNIADNSDMTGVSFYPKNLPAAMEESVRCQAMTAVRSASLTGEYIISELQTHKRSMFDAFSATQACDIRLWNWEAISCGAKGIIYWKWEPFIKGLQTYGRGLVDNKGNMTDRAEEAGKIANLITNNYDMFSSFKPEKARVAILYDGLNQDFIKAFCNDHEPQYAKTIYNDSVKGLYKCLWKLNIPVDFIRPLDIENGNVSQYKMIFMTNQTNTSEAFLKSVFTYVDDGGLLFTDGRFSVINNEGLLFSDIPGGDFNSDFGYRVDDLESSNGLIQCCDMNCDFPSFHERQFLQLGSGSVITAKYSDSIPAIVEHKKGKGKIIHAGTMLWLSYYHENSANIEKYISKYFNDIDALQYYDSSGKVVIRAIEKGSEKLVFMFNYTSKKIHSTIEIKNLPSGFFTIDEINDNKSFDQECVENTLKLSTSIESKDVKLYRLRPIK
jgi:beta-galactosidase